MRFSMQQLFRRYPNIIRKWDGSLSKKNTFPLGRNGEFGNNISEKTLAGSFRNVTLLVSYFTPPMLSHTLCSCVGCNACRNTSTSSSEEDKTTLSTDSSRTVCDTTSAASDAKL